jgi:SAM-dependent methyltransferase
VDSSSCLEPWQSKTQRRLGGKRKDAVFALMLECRMLICPQCRMALGLDLSADTACACGRSYPRLDSGGLDFLRGAEFPDFVLDPDDPVQHRHLEREAEGVSWRIEKFILPLLERYQGTVQSASGAVAVLDCGCGNGVSVDALRSRGMDAWGIDAGRARHRQWQARSSGPYLHSADALHLPFGDHSFDAVMSSGLIEHIGIHEEVARRYRSARLRDCHARRGRFIAEMVRITRPAGFILLDHPNGSFPVDFWHGGPAGGLRWHSRKDDMLPRYAEVSRYFAESDPALILFSLSPALRLRFDQVRQHWYGLVFAPVMKLWLAALARRPLSFLARSAANPYLVTIAARDPKARAWIYA